MRRLRMTVVVLGVVLAWAPAAFADVSSTPAQPPAPSSLAAPSPAAGTSAPASLPPPSPAAGAFAPTPARTGLAVVALTGVADAAWPLAQSVYADPTLRP